MNLWPKLHGASTHFPLALAMAAVVFDGLGIILASPRKEGLHAAGRCAILLGAAGVIPAVLSGLFLTKGEAWGHGVLLYHHLFVWPAFTAIIGLGVWRGLVGDRPSRRGFTAYFVALVVTAALMTGAGYWGGELLLAS